jgi:hypothetical protein
MLIFIGRGDWRATCDPRGDQRGLCGHPVRSHSSGAHHGELKAGLVSFSFYRSKENLFKKLETFSEIFGNV